MRSIGEQYHAQNACGDGIRFYLSYMEDLLKVYAQSSSCYQPLVGLDESSQQPVFETRPAIKAKPGQPLCYDDEYECNGVSHRLMSLAPVDGWHHVKVMERRTKVDWAPWYGRAFEALFSPGSQSVHGPRPPPYASSRIPL
ncbi:hypothetical protein NKDENANG_02472 [Candidatus Entotheonellaceae bacterium PAL068K]